MSKWGFTWGDPDNAWWGIDLDETETLNGVIFGGVNGTLPIVAEREVCIHVIVDGVDLPYVVGGSRNTNLYQGFVQRDEITIQLLDVDGYYSTGAGAAKIAPRKIFKLSQETKTAGATDTRDLGVFRFKSNPDITQDSEGTVISVKGNEWARYPFEIGGVALDTVGLINVFAPDEDLEGVSYLDIIGYMYTYMGTGAYEVFIDGLEHFPNIVPQFPAGLTKTILNQNANLTKLGALPPKTQEDILMAYVQMVHSLIWFDGDGNVHITTADAGPMTQGLFFTCGSGVLNVPGESINREMSPPQYSSVAIIQPRTWAQMYAEIGESPPIDTRNLKGTISPKRVAFAQALNARYPTIDAGESKPMDIIDLGATSIPLPNDQFQYYAMWLMHEELAKADIIKVTLDSAFPFNAIGQVVTVDYPPIARGFYKLTDVSVPFDESPQSWTLQWHHDAADHTGVIAP